jgi:hypothetical protein
MMVTMPSGAILMKACGERQAIKIQRQAATGQGAQLKKRSAIDMHGWSLPS